MKIESLFPHVTEEHRQINHAITLLGKAIAHLKCEAFNSPNLGAAIQCTRLATEHLNMSYLARKKATRETN